MTFIRCFFLIRGTTLHADRHQTFGFQPATEIKVLNSAYLKSNTNTSHVACKLPAKMLDPLLPSTICLTIPRTVGDDMELERSSTWASAAPLPKSFTTTELPSGSAQRIRTFSENPWDLWPETRAATAEGHPLPR